jgi:hypothetical protein
MIGWLQFQVPIPEATTAIPIPKVRWFPWYLPLFSCSLQAKAGTASYNSGFRPLTLTPFQIKHSTPFYNTTLPNLSTSKNQKYEFKFLLDPH